MSSKSNMKRAITEISEERLQAQFWEWAWNTYPQFRRLMWAVPNSTNTNAIQASRLKATGLLPGVWDLHVLYKREYHIIETKIGDNKLTVDRVVNGRKTYGQYEWGELMAANGATRHIYYTLEEGQAIYKAIFGLN
jgi:hypothetical protein